MPLYKGEFNWYDESYVLHRHSSTAQRAWFFMTLNISKTVKTSHNRVKYYFGGMKSNYKITEVPVEKATQKERQINNSYEIKREFEKSTFTPKKWKMTFESFAQNGPVKIFTRDEIETYKQQLEMR
jgi:hypothetical protein